MDLNQFKSWADEKPYHIGIGGRLFTVEYRGAQEPPYVCVGEYFGGRYICQVGVMSVDEIDMEGKMEREDLAAYEKLALKYGGDKK